MSDHFFERKRWLSISFIFVTCLAATWLGWIGYTDSDDQFYAAAASGWIAHFPYVGTNHWGLRHAIVLPIAVSFALAGATEAMLVLPIAICFLALAGLTFFAVDRFVDAKTAFVASTLFTLTPLFSLSASIVRTDLVELFFVSLSFWAFYQAIRRNGSPRSLILAGASAGVAWITRETSIALVLLYAVLFLAGTGIPRVRYLWIAGGFLGIVMADTLYLWYSTGDLLYRYHVTFQAVAADNPVVKAQERQAELIAAPKFFRPFLVVFLTHEFGLLNFLAVPAAAWLSFSRAISPRLRDLARLLSALAVIWFTIISYAFGDLLWNQPRYQSVPAYCAVVLLALWITQIGSVRGPKLSLAAMVLLMITNVLLTDADNKDLLFGERSLVSVSLETREPIYTDSATRGSADFLLRAAGSVERVFAGPPIAGSLFFYNPTPRRPSKGNDPRVQPADSWRLIVRFTEKRKVTATLLRGSGLADHLPLIVQRKIDPPQREVMLYRLQSP